VGTLVQLTGVAKPAAAPACVCRLHTVAVRQAALVSDESALEACLRRCATQIDDLYLFYLWTENSATGCTCLFNTTVCGGYMDFEKIRRKDIGSIRDVLLSKTAPCQMAGLPDKWIHQKPTQSPTHHCRQSQTSQAKAVWSHLLHAGQQPVKEKKVLFGMVESRNHQERPRKRSVDDILKWCDMTSHYKKHHTMHKIVWSEELS